MNTAAAPSPEMIPANANPFSLRTVLVLVVLGVAIFIALLWMIGAGKMAGSTNDGGNHADGRGLNGFAVFAQFLEKQGYDVARTLSETALDEPGLLVLTPPHYADAGDISRIISRRRRDGPTLIVLPKWSAMKVPEHMQTGDVEKGWVILGEPMPVRWSADVAALGALKLRTAKAGARAATWRGFGLSGAMADANAVQTMFSGVSGASGRIAPLVEDGRGQMLAGYLNDGGRYDRLAAAARVRGGREGFNRRAARRNFHPVVIVADPDLLNNYGFARQENAMLARALVRATTGGERMPVTFDLTLNGHARSSNLLTLAFSPPFLAATLCLLMAALAVGWRAFLRFGAASRPDRAIAFGKSALVANVAGLVRRTGRLHLVSGPYADSTRERIVRALALPGGSDTAATDAAIDRALKSRARDAMPFSKAAANLRAARNRHDAVKAAQDLHMLERTLTR